MTPGRIVQAEALAEELSAEWAARDRAREEVERKREEDIRAAQSGMNAEEVIRILRERP